jgi:hypothetical protein
MIAQERLPAELLLKWCNDVAPAAHFLGHIALIARLADDIIDQPAAENNEQRMMLLLVTTLHHLTSDPWFDNHRDGYRALLATATMSWAASERWKTSENRTVRVFGYVYRDLIEQILYYTALLCGGPTFALRVMNEAREHFSLHTETLEEWEQEHGIVWRRG